MPEQSQSDPTKDPNYLLKLENAIGAKYGDETIAHPRANWDEVKEREYLRQLKEAELKKDAVLDAKQFVATTDGFLVSEKLQLKREQNTCKICSTRPLKKFDTIYLIKYGCCYSCFISNKEAGRKAH